MFFRLWTIFYVFALVASALATFGAWGIAAAAIVLGFWLIMFSGSKPAMTLLKCLIAIFLVLSVIALLLPAISTVREASRRTQCLNNLKQIALAVLAYESEHGHFPTNQVTDSAGQPTLSWRAQILPLLERDDLFQGLDCAKPWNDPANQFITSIAIELYRCPSDPSPAPLAPTTNYFAVVGSNTAWPEDRGRALSEITDNRSQTILLIEVAGMNARWAEPKDLTFDEAINLLTNLAPESVVHAHYGNDGFFGKSYGKTVEGVHVAMADGNPRFLSLPLPKDIAIALLTANGGEEDLSALFNQHMRPQLDYGKCYSFALFVFLSLLPIVRILRRKSEQPGMYASGSDE